MDRYKFKNQKFCHATDAKKLRVLQSQNNRKLQRSNTFFNNRVLDTPDTRNSVHTSLKPSTSKGHVVTTERNTKTYSKKEISELSKLRYQKMLLFKEEKKRQKEVDKKRRRPVFHTGVYQPDAPTFLSAEKIDVERSLKKTPFISTSKRPIAKNASAISAKSKKRLTFVTKSAQMETPSVPIRMTRSRYKSQMEPPLSIKNKPIPNFSPISKKKLVKGRIATPGRPRSFAPKNFKFSGISGLDEIIIVDKKSDKKRKLINKLLETDQDKENISGNRILSPKKNNLSSTNSGAKVSVYLQTPTMVMDISTRKPLSSLQRRRSRQATPLEKMFLNSNIDSPLPLTFSDEEDDDYHNGNDTLTVQEVSLMALLEPSKPSKNAQPSASEIKSNTLLLKKNSKKQNLSVSFASTKDTENTKCYKGTPLPGRSSRKVRLSLLPGLFDKECTTPKEEHNVSNPVEDLISFNTPKSVQVSNSEIKSNSLLKKKNSKKQNLSVSFASTKDTENTKRYKGTPLPRRSSQMVRLSLLPGLYDKECTTPKEEHNVSNPVKDLISFNTPKSGQVSTKTPLRRSARLSRI